MREWRLCGLDFGGKGWIFLIGIVYVTPQCLSKGMFKADRFVNLFAIKDSRVKRF